MNCAITKPWVSTCAGPPVPTLVYPTCCSNHARVAATAAWCAASTLSDTALGATAHRVDTDFTGENVRSNPATADRAGLRHPAQEPGQLLPGARVPVVLLGEHLPRQVGADPGPVLLRHPLPRRPPELLVPVRVRLGEPLMPLHGAVVDGERLPEPGRRGRRRHRQALRHQLGLDPFGVRVDAHPEQVPHLPLS